MFHCSCLILSTVLSVHRFHFSFLLFSSFLFFSLFSSPFFLFFFQFFFSLSFFSPLLSLLFLFLSPSRSILDKRPNCKQVQLARYMWEPLVVDNPVAAAVAGIAVVDHLGTVAVDHLGTVAVAAVVVRNPVAVDLVEQSSTSLLILLVG